MPLGFVLKLCSFSQGGGTTMSLLREIQNELARSGADVTAVLRKCKILAARLGSAEFAKWVDFHLGGYPEDQPIPEYRQLA